MFPNKYFHQFCKERNIKKSTQQGYQSALKNYTDYHKLTLTQLIEEALQEEEKNIPLRNRKIRKRLLNYRTYLLKTKKSQNTIRTYFTKIKSFYHHFSIEIPHLPETNYHKNYETNYLDLPTKKHIRQVLDIVGVDLRAVILFMSSSGTAKAETLSLTVEQFIDATEEYHNGGDLETILNTLENKRNIIPTFYLKRIKTDKYYYTFCSPEASSEIVKYLKTRNNLTIADRLFDFTSSTLLTRFQEINDGLGWGFKGKYRFFRSHSLRKFHASNIGLSAEYIDALQGRSKNSVHESYIKTNPEELKKIYKNNMKNVMVGEVESPDVQYQEFNITINVFLSGKEYNIF